MIGGAARPAAYFLRGTAIPVAGRYIPVGAVASEELDGGLREGTGAPSAVRERTYEEGSSICFAVPEPAAAELGRAKVSIVLCERDEMGLGAVAR